MFWRWWWWRTSVITLVLHRNVCTYCFAAFFLHWICSFSRSAFQDAPKWNIWIGVALWYVCVCDARLDIPYSSYFTSLFLSHFISADTFCTSITASILTKHSAIVVVSLIDLCVHSSPCSRPTLVASESVKGTGWSCQTKPVKCEPNLPIHLSESSRRRRRWYNWARYYKYCHCFFFLTAMEARFHSPFFPVLSKLF